MTISNPLIVLHNVFSDVRRKHDFSYKPPPQTPDDSLDKEFDVHPTASNCTCGDD